MLAGAIIAGIVSGCSDSPEDAKKEHEDDLQLLAYMAAKDSVRNQLKAPASAQFPEIYDANVHIAKTGPGDRFTLAGVVDSQNSFGALLRAKWTATATCNAGSCTAEATLIEGQ